MKTHHAAKCVAKGSVSLLDDIIAGVVDALSVDLVLLVKIAGLFLSGR